MAGEPSKNAQKIMDIMDLYDLCAVNTMFEPKRGGSVHTYLCPKQKKKKECAQGDFGHHVGERVACKYKGNLVQGDVIAVSLGDGEETQDEWTVQFEDGHVITCLWKGKITATPEAR